MCMCLSMCGYGYMCLQSPQAITGSPRGAVKDSYKPPEIGATNYI